MESPKFLDTLKPITFESLTQSHKYQLTNYIHKAKYNSKDVALYSAGAAYLCDWVLCLMAKAEKKEEVKTPAISDEEALKLYAK
jgi:hypothetical protein